MFINKFMHNNIMEKFRKNIKSRSLSHNPLSLRAAKKMPKSELILDASGFRGPRDGVPETYPGKRTPGSYLLIGSKVHLIAFEEEGELPSASVLHGNDFVRVSRILRDAGLPRIDDMYLLIGYGSNPCPGQVRSKIKEGREKYNLEDIKDIAVVVRGAVKNCFPAVGSFSLMGYPHATTLGGPVAENAEFEAWGTFADPNLLYTMNKSEEIDGPEAVYKLAGGFKFQVEGAASGGKPLYVPAGGYVGTSNIFAPSFQDGYSGPVGFDTIPSQCHSFPCANVQEIFGLTLEGMARDDGSFGIDSLLAERGIRAKGAGQDSAKALLLMKWLNSMWRRGKERELMFSGLIKAVRSHMAKYSYPYNMLEEKEAEGSVFPSNSYDPLKNPAYRPEGLRFGKLLESATTG